MKSGSEKTQQNDIATTTEPSSTQITWDTPEGASGGRRREGSGGGGGGGGGCCCGGGGTWTDPRRLGFLR